MKNMILLKISQKIYMGNENLNVRIDAPQCGNSRIGNVVLAMKLFGM